MQRSRIVVVTAIAVAAALTLAACSSSEQGSSSDRRDTGSCPSEPIDIVVTVDQWGDIVRRLAGACGDVTTIITGADADPHDFEPSPRDNAAFTDADLVVVNGLGYDAWADNVLDTLSSEPAMIDAAEVVGRTDGDNPHLWYDPDAVQEVARALTATLEELLPDAAAYLDDQATVWEQALQSYRDEIAAVEASARGRSYAATEPVFDEMAAAVGLLDRTPEGYRNAATNESDPSPGDIHDFEEILRSGEVDVLVVNTQTEGSIPEQLRAVAEKARIPIVEVTETAPDDVSSFVDWQITQLRALAEALGR